MMEAIARVLLYVKTSDLLAGKEGTGTIFS